MPISISVVTQKAAMVRTVWCRAPTYVFFFVAGFRQRVTGWKAIELKFDLSHYHSHGWQLSPNIFTALKRQLFLVAGASFASSGLNSDGTESSNAFSIRHHLNSEEVYQAEFVRRYISVGRFATVL